MATPSSFGDGNGDNMDASLWGQLQIFIDLSMIYAKLPLAPFFHLRQVCKEWDRLASDCQFLEQNFKPPISSNPYFILDHPSRGHILLISKGSLWTSMLVPRIRCEMLGLLFEDSNCNRVFDLHTRVFHTLPPIPVAMQLSPLLTNYKCALIMMTVDTTQIPYGFRIIVVDEIIGTMIYESNCGFWTHKPSTSVCCPHAYGPSCVHYNKSLCMKVDIIGGSNLFRMAIIQTYNLERDEWNHQRFWLSWGTLPYTNIGMWQDRWFLFSEDEEEDGLGLTVWKFNSNFEKPCTFIDYMPQDLRGWMEDSKYYSTTKFYGEHVLVYNYSRSVNRAILSNLDRKTWDKIEWPKIIPMLQ